MKEYRCPHCKKVMYDDDHSTRFRCQFCGEFVEGYEKELEEKLKEAMPELFKSKDDTVR